MTTNANQGDLLLWVAGGVVAAVGVAWLVIMKPWDRADAPRRSRKPSRAHAVALPTVRRRRCRATSAPGRADQGTLDNPLRMAELAYRGRHARGARGIQRVDAVLRASSSRSRATRPPSQGLTKVADDLVRRGETALEQGRFDDARAAVERIRAVLPEHAGAKALAEKIWPAGSRSHRAVARVLSFRARDAACTRRRRKSRPSTPAAPAEAGSRSARRGRIRSIRGGDAAEPAADAGGAECEALRRES